MEIAFVFMHIYWISCIFIFGVCVGSFMNVVVWRLPRGGSIVFPSSHCPLCGFKVRWFDNIPLISYLILLRCKCRRCKSFISPRYPIVEFLTGILLVNLYICFFLLHMRSGFEGGFRPCFPQFFAYAVLTWTLLTATLTDIETFTVPLGVCWFASLVGVLANTFWPTDANLLPPVSHTTGAVACAAGVGLLISIMLQRAGFLLPSFIDADYRPRNDEEGQIATTSSCGVSPRKEILKEVLFLAPAISLAIIASWAVKNPLIAPLWESVYALAGHQFGVFFSGFQSSLFGFLIGGLWIWGIRILGTLAFGKEAMGLGDVHILAAVGAVTGWITPSLTFFAAPFGGIIYAILVLLRKNQKELPYGPWLALAAYLIIIFQKYLLQWLTADGMPLHLFTKYFIFK